MFRRFGLGVDLRVLNDLFRQFGTRTCYTRSYSKYERTLVLVSHCQLSDHFSRRQKSFGYVPIKNH
jgi:hypothetical protein